MWDKICRERGYRLEIHISQFDEDEETASAERVDCPTRYQSLV